MSDIYPHNAHLVREERTGNNLSPVTDVGVVLDKSYRQNFGADDQNKRKIS